MHHDVLALHRLAVLACKAIWQAAIAGRIDIRDLSAA
jgi:hypothetical protein